MRNRSTPDVLVVGAGIIGASTAWRLAQNGLTVTLIDAGAYSGESSRAGAGMLAPGGEFGGNSRWSHFAVESRRLYPAFAAELEAESGEQIDLRLCGALELTRGEDEWQRLTSRAAIQEAAGVRAEPLDRDAAIARAPALDASSFDRAMFYPDDAIVDPVDVTRALRVVLERLGVAVVENSPVTEIGVRSGGVVAGGERYQPGTTIVAAGAWASALLPPRAPRSTPVKGHLVGYSLSAGFLHPVVRRGHTYFLQRSNGFLIAGATTERVGFDRVVDGIAAHALHLEASEYLPDLRARKPDRAWIGLRPGAIDAAGAISNEPIVQRLALDDGTESDVWLSYGHYRNGILLAPVTAKLLAGEIATNSSGTVSANWGRD